MLPEIKKTTKNVCVLCLSELILMSYGNFPLGKVKTSLVGPQLFYM